VSSQPDQAPTGDSAAAGVPLADGSMVGGALPSAGQDAGDGTKVYRLSGPLVLWWAWVALAVISLGDLAVQGHNRSTITPALVIFLITGLVYACALRPRVLADDEGLTVQNPLRDYRIPWGAIKGVYLGDSVEIQCARQVPRGDKNVYSWGLYSSRRARYKMRNEARSRRGMRYQPPQYGRMPAEAQEALKQGPGQAIAKELARLAEAARERGVIGGAISAQWVWPSLAAILVPALVLVLWLVL
jgi:hypothetical protein